ncbi:MAG: hypothetical protein LIO87_02770 [Eubacterium sp.]|nr:hypothetical protein [Eubacterium sp.]
MAAKYIDRLKPFSLTIIAFTMFLIILVPPSFMTVGYGFWGTFDRVFGHATAAGINASARITLFTLYNVVAIPLSLLIASYLIYRFIKNINELQGEVREFLNEIAIALIILLFPLIYNKYSTEFYNDGFLNQFNSFGIDVWILLIATIFLLHYNNQPHKRDVIKLKFSFYLSISLVFSLNFLAPFLLNENKNIFPHTLIFLITFLGCTVLLEKVDFGRFAYATQPLFFTLFLGGIFLELTNILNQYDIFIIQRTVYLKIIIGSLIATSWAMYVCFPKRRLSSFPTISLIGFLAGLAWFTTLPPLIYNAGTELFEQANHGMLANDFLVYGKLPIINSFDGHMLRTSFNSILYGLFNDDALGASYVGRYFDIFNIIAIIALFLFLRTIFNESFAFIFSTFFRNCLLFFHLTSLD